MLVFLLASAPGLARPDAPSVFCGIYPDAPTCTTGAVSCATCHDIDGPPVLNPYGSAVLGALDPAQAFIDALPDALIAVEALDSDKDGIDNLTEINQGSWPGFDSAIEPECLPQLESGNATYTVGRYDPFFAFKRITLDFCGRSPRYDERQAFQAQMASWGWLPGDGEPMDFRVSSQVVGRLHEQLEACLLSPYWDSVLEEIGVGVVQPSGYNSDLYILGNYEWDLRLFAYALSGDRPASDLLEADYLVVEDPVGSGLLTAIDEPRNDTERYAQPLASAHRYGLITTRFSLAMNVMFAPVPRTLVSHWYRELLGMDLAISEGLYPVDELDGELDWAAPLDVDEKGVWQEECAGCHTTIDPLSYPWARYQGIDLEGDTTGTWVDDRATDLLPGLDGAIFGEPISGPDEWVAAAASSDPFHERTVELFWQYLFRRAPYSCEAEELTSLWQGLRDGSYPRVGAARPGVVEDMLQELVLLDAYGTP